MVLRKVNYASPPPGDRRSIEAWKRKLRGRGRGIRDTRAAKYHNGRFPKRWAEPGSTNTILVGHSDRPGRLIKAKSERVPSTAIYLEQVEERPRTSHDSPKSDFPKSLQCHISVRSWLSGI